MDADRVASRVIEYLQQYNLPQAGGALEVALAKFPDHPSVRVAEALYLARTCRTTVAKAKAEAAAKLNITQPAIVDALVRALQQCCAWESLAATYERLLPTQNKRSVSENLVQTYARMGAYDKLQATATSLYREYNDARYQVWIVQACLAQVPADSTDHLFLKLATRLLDAAVLTEKGKTTPTTVRAFVDVLVQQQQVEEAINFLCSTRGSKIGLLETRLELLATLLQRQGRYKLANATAKYLWQLHPDNWVPVQIYQHTLASPCAPLQDTDAEDCVLQLESDEEALRATICAADADSSLTAAIALAKTLQATEEAERPRKVNRGPYLAELAFRAAENTAGADGLHDAILAYVQRLYTKPCCYLDVSTFLSKTSAEAIYEWSKQGAAGGVGEEEKGNDAVRLHTRRVLGLKCLVGTWGTTAETQPPIETMHAIMCECREAYDATKSLSAGLAWSEEGLCDGYLSVAMNIALRGYVREGCQNDDWLYRGLELQQGVERRMNNPSWLIFAVGFASALGLTDSAALHQLAFKSIQFDTMTHIGYWPMRRGVALEDIETWESAASDYYSRVEQDCSLLRAKVFNFISWPAMKDVQKFEKMQMNSVGRWAAAAQECAANLRTCQTQDNIVEVMQQYGPELVTARAVLADPARELVDNSDRLVIRSLVLGNIHTSEVETLAAALVPVPSTQTRREEALQLLDSLLLLHDVAMLERHRQTLAHAPKPRKANQKGGQQQHADPAMAAPTLYTPSLTAQPPQYLPRVAPIAKVLRTYLETNGETSAVYTDDLKQALDQLLTEGRSAFEAFLYPEAYILAGLVRTATVSKVPVKEWSGELHAMLQTAQSKLAEGAAGGAWSPRAVAASADDTTLTHSLYVEKSRRVTRYLADLLVDVGATTKRK